MCVHRRFSGFLAHKLPLPYKLRYGLAAIFNSIAMASMNLLKGNRTLPALQTNLYTEETPKTARITFSLFSFPVEDYPQVKFPADALAFLTFMPRREQFLCGLGLVGLAPVHATQVLTLCAMQ